MGQISWVRETANSQKPGGTVMKSEEVYMLWIDNDTYLGVYDKPYDAMKDAYESLHCDIFHDMKATRAEKARLTKAFNRSDWLAMQWVAFGVTSWWYSITTVIVDKSDCVEIVTIEAAKGGSEWTTKT